VTDDGGSTRRRLRIGTRGSALALIQARAVADGLRRLGTATEIVVIRTEGDDRAIDTAWGEGAFVGRIVEGLLRAEVDLAVHSAKDVPTDEHPDLVIAAYPGREDPRDALVAREPGATLATLPAGARIGTDSPRRRAFLLAVRPDLVIHPLHGNVDTRLAKLERGETDALILAVAGLARLGRTDRISEILPIETVAPAPGQGALAIQVRADDHEAQALVAPLDDLPTRSAVVAERTMLNATGGGCRSPIGAFGRADGGTLELLAAAERTFSPSPDAAIGIDPVVWLRDRAEAADERAMAVRLAARVVAARARPRVLVARAASQAAPLMHALDERGIEAVSVPAIEVVPTGPDGPLDDALATSPRGTMVVVSSPNAATAISEAMDRIDREHSVFRWAAVGPSTAALLSVQGSNDVFVPTVHSGEGLAAELPLERGDHVLLPRADIAHEALPQALRARGARVEVVVAYRTLEAPDPSRPLLAEALDGPLDALVLTSGSSARGLLALAEGTTEQRLRATPVVAIGQPTSTAARDLGYARILTAPEPAVPALAAFTAVALGLASRATPGDAP
jgi:hydroxymethylbilane synthase